MTAMTDKPKEVNNGTPWNSMELHSLALFWRVKQERQPRGTPATVLAALRRFDSTIPLSHLDSLVPLRLPCPT